MTTWHNDLARSGVSSQETILTPQNVNVGQFGKVFSIKVDGYVYAQPLVLGAVNISGGTHNVVYVATEHDSVYAIDADDGTQLELASLIPNGGTTASPSDLNGCGDITPEVGITGTPVIDPSTQTLYMVAKSKINGSIVQYLHALNAGSLAEKNGSPVQIQATAAGTAADGDGSKVTFNPLTQHQRPGLALTNGHVIISWASHCDDGPYHGWVMSYNASTLAQEAVWDSTPNSTEGGIWMSGAAPTVDGAGNIYLATGNGKFDGLTEFSNSIVKLGPPANGQFALLDWFSPSTAIIGSGDNDVGAGGVLLLPTASTGKTLLLEAGKASTMYLLDSSNLGKTCTSCAADTQIAQEISDAGSAFSTPAYWNGSVFWNLSGQAAGAWSFDANSSGLLSTAPVSQTGSATFARSAAASISANGRSNGIYWIMNNTGQLLAYDATNLATELWDSGQNNGRDSAGSAVKFAPPTIANGKVYVGTQSMLVAYGVLSATAAATPTFSPGQGTYATAQTVTVSDATVGAQIYYTTDGSTPTTSSTAYSGPITVSASETLQAIAAVSGMANSAVASAAYKITSSGGGGGTTPAPVFSPTAGTYTGTQSVTLSDSTSGAKIYYTTDGSPPGVSSTVYSGPIIVSTTQTLQAIAVADGDEPSTVVSARFTINASGGSSASGGAGGGGGAVDLAEILALSLMVFWRLSSRPAFGRRGAGG